MLSISLSLPGCKPDLEDPYLNTTMAHHRVHGRAILRLLVRLMEYKGRIGYQLHNLIWSLIDSTTRYKPISFNRNHRALLKHRSLLPLSSVKNVSRPFQSDISWTSIWRNTFHHSNVMIAVKLFNIEKTSSVTANPSTQKQLTDQRCYIVLIRGASSLLTEVTVPQEETI